MWKIPPIRIPNIFTECGCWLWSIIRAAYFVQRLFLRLSPLSSSFSPCLCDVRGYRGQMCQGSIKGWCLHLGNKSSHHSRIQGWYVQAWNSLAASLPFSSVAQSCPTFCDLVNTKHTRSPCPLSTPRVHPNPCPSSRWCNPVISSSVVPFSSCPQSFPVLGSFPMSQLLASCGQRIGVSASTSVLPMNTQDWPPLGWTGWISLQSKGLSRVFSNTTVQKHQLAASVSFICNSLLPGRQPSAQLHLGWFSSKLSCSGFLRDLKIKFAAISDVKEVEALDWVGWCCWMVGAVF